MIDFREKMNKYIEDEVRVTKGLDLEKINEAINAIVDCRNRDGIVYTMGNGGSASTASHFVCDFSKGLSEEVGGKRFIFECLSDNVATMMAVANDISYDEIFKYQLEKRLTPNDLIIAISGSGNSKNVIKAVEYARSVGTKIIGITGYKGGKLKELADYSMHVDVEDMQIAEDVHMMFDHMMMRVISQVILEKNQHRTE